MGIVPLPRHVLGFPDSSIAEEYSWNAGNPGSISGLGRSPGEGKGYPLQYSGLENSMDFIVHGVRESDTTEVTQQQPSESHSVMSNSL